MWNIVFIKGQAVALQWKPQTAQQWIPWENPQSCCSTQKPSLFGACSVKTNKQGFHVQSHWMTLSFCVSHSLLCLFCYSWKPLSIFRLLSVVFLLSFLAPSISTQSRSLPLFLVSWQPLEDWRSLAGWLLKIVANFFASTDEDVFREVRDEEPLCSSTASCWGVCHHRPVAEDSLSRAVCAICQGTMWWGKTIECSSASFSGPPACSQSAGDVNVELKRLHNIVIVHETRWSWSSGNPLEELVWSRTLLTDLP